MAALHEKYLWPLIGVVIFAVLAAFYIDDRRRLVQDHTETDANKQASSDTSMTSKSSNYQKQSSTNSSSKNQASKTSIASSDTSHKGFSGSIEDYLAQISEKRSKQLEAAVKDHQGFSGSIEDYLGSKQTTQVASAKQSSTGSTTSSSLSMDEYTAKTEGKASASSAKQTNHSQGAYHGSIDGYLAKYGGGKQTPISDSGEDPFNEEEHKGFHGSYEDYAKKYN